MTDVGRLERRLGARLGQAVGDFELIAPGDRILPIPGRRSRRPCDRLPMAGGGPILHPPALAGLLAASLSATAGLPTRG